WRFEGFFADVTYTSRGRQQTKVAVQVPELDGLAQRVFLGPFLARQRLADERHVRRLQGVAVIEEPSLQQGNAKRAEVALARRAILGIARAGWIVEQLLEFLDEARQSFVFVHSPDLADGARQSFVGIHHDIRAV